MATGGHTLLFVTSVPYCPRKGRAISSTGQEGDLGAKRPGLLGPALQLDGDGCRAPQPLSCPPSLLGPGVRGVLGGWGAVGGSLGREQSFRERPGAQSGGHTPTVVSDPFLGRAHGRSVTAPGGSPIASHVFTGGPAQLSPRPLFTLPSPGRDQHLL